MNRGGKLATAWRKRSRLSLPLTVTACIKPQNLNTDSRWTKSMQFNIAPHDLAALLSSKLCHDLISPVGAINNGLELLEEGGADEDAMNLIKNSARTASARLQYARIAYGAAGSPTVQIDTGDARNVAVGFMLGEKAELTWEGGRFFLPKNRVKLLLNMLQIANGSIPRGGSLAVMIEGDENNPVFIIKSSGPMLRVPSRFVELHGDAPEHEPIDAHSIQAYYALLLARETNMDINVNVRPEDITFTIKQKDVAAAAA
jgi:histidine phosphotransferase ChpT